MTEQLEIWKLDYKMCKSEIKVRKILNKFKDNITIYVYIFFYNNK